MDDLERAIEIALDAYEGQTDKAGETYIRHPLRVMEQVETRRQRVVAVLHDVVEDSEYDLGQIEDAFDAEIRDAVDAMTKRDGEDYLDDFIPRVAENDIARAVKFADIEDNMDITRLPEVSDDVLEKQATYHSAWQRLQGD
ncbi:HD domain-containing protein [Halorientalis marina]|uniref:HD domain-containing protein n=1 Tax=Halorientalis marina TaxID=2931976 RepID=UPI001FF66E66|nr:HD domain-containing protein [Halorientalis marina]